MLDTENASPEVPIEGIDIETKKPRPDLLHAQDEKNEKRPKISDLRQQFEAEQKKAGIDAEQKSKEAGKEEQKYRTLVQKREALEREQSDVYGGKKPEEVLFDTEFSNIEREFQELKKKNAGEEYLLLGEGIDNTEKELREAKELLRDIGSSGGKDSEINKKVTDEIKIISEKLEATQREYRSWNQDFQKLLKEMMEKFKITGSTPENKAKRDEIINEIGNEVSRRKKLEKHAKDIIGRRQKIDQEILDVMSNEEVQDLLFDVSEQEIRDSQEFARMVEGLYTQERSKSGEGKTEISRNITKSLIRDVAEKFFQIEVQQQGLNDPKLTIEERKKKMSNLYREISTGFQGASTFYRELLNNNKILDSQENKLKTDALFLSYLIGAGPGTSEAAGGVFENLEYNRFVAKGERYDQSQEGEKKAHLQKRIRPYFPIINMVKAALDAEQKVLSEQYNYDTRRNNGVFSSSLRQISSNDYSHRHNWGMEYNQKGKSMVPGIASDEATVSDNADIRENSATYETTFKRYTELISKELEAGIVEERQELTTLKRKQEQFSEEIELAKKQKEQIDSAFENIKSVSDKIVNADYGRTDLRSELEKIIRELARLESDSEKEGLLGRLFKGTNAKKEKVNLQLLGLFQQVFPSPAKVKALMNNPLIAQCQVPSIQTLSSFELPSYKSGLSASEILNKQQMLQSALRNVQQALENKRRQIEDSDRKLQRQKEENKGEIDKKENSIIMKIYGSKRK